MLIPPCRRDAYIATRRSMMLIRRPAFCLSAMLLCAAAYTLRFSYYAIVIFPATAPCFLLFQRDAPPAMLLIADYSPIALLLLLCHRLSPLILLRHYLRPRFIRC